MEDAPTTLFATVSVNRRTGKAVGICNAHHGAYCAICGLSLPLALDAAHLDQNPGNDDPGNLAWLCKTHHKLVDVGFYPVEMVKFLRDRWTAYGKGEWKPDANLYMKDAAKRAALTQKGSRTAKLAWAKRREKMATDKNSEG